MSDVAIAHEKLLSYGGAQNVAFEMARALNAPIYTLWKDEQYIPDDVEVIQLATDRQKLALKLPTVLTDFYHMLRWSHVSELYDYETVILNKTNTAWFVPAPHQHTIHYVHSPPRSIFDKWHREPQSVRDRLSAVAQRALNRHAWDYQGTIIANSETVANRLETYLNITADEVIYPPVKTEKLSPDVAPTNGTYLSLGRLAPNKRIPDVVDVCESTGRTLTVAGSGQSLNKVKAHASENTRLLGAVSEKTKRRLTSEASAFIFAAEQEDFGMAPIEALASGTPVIGVNEGHTKHQIEDGKNGILYDRGELADALDRFESDGVELSTDEIAESATQYNDARFAREIRRVVDGN